ncbi:radical SAM protein [Patescibacteria group bacterium]|nr:radical SAM protein [Patescibacteria group bacterium]
MKTLDYVQWDITSRCNLNCLHCREKIVEEVKDDLDFDECKMLIDQISAFNTHTLSIAGGEPLLSPNIEKVLYYAKGKFKRLVISSNGTIMNDRILKMLKDCVTNVQISLDGSNAEIHDKIRGRGVFNKAISVIRLLQKNDINVGVRLTLCDYNKDYVREYIDLASNLKLKDAYLRRIIPSGNAKKYGLLPLSAKELKAVLGDAISYGKSKGIHVASADYFCQIEFNNEARRKAEKISSMKGEVIGGCAVGINSFYVMQNGLIVYCPYLPVFCGDLRKESLESIWKNSEMFKIARSIRHNLKGKCSVCTYKFSCGGCRAYAYATTGDILASDNGCWIKQPIK